MFRRLLLLGALAGTLTLSLAEGVGAVTMPADTVETKTRFEVAKTTPDNEDDLEKKAMDLRTPENITTAASYDEKTHTYLVGSRLGDDYLSVPLLMSPEEYQKWSMKQSLDAYFRAKNEEAFEKEGKKEKFDFSDMHFDLGPAEKIFGPGGVQVKTQGTAELKFGFNQKSIDNPSLPQRSRNTFGFDFDEKINLSINGKVGDKINMNMNYNTEATFDFDTKKLKLKYEGKEDEIIKLLEAGNVSFPSNSPLIQGSSSLFGIRADLQFGKLSLQTVISQKTSQSSSVSSKGGTQTTEFEIDVADYDENRHFFLAHYFRDTYDQNMAQLPTIMSGIQITRIELWVTNKTSSYDNPRNILAFTDLGEATRISNASWHAAGGTLPANAANDLYASMVGTYAAVRDIDQVGAVLGGLLSGSSDYEKISNARLLNSSEYTLNKSLGYISLRSALKSDEVLAVAFEYTSGGKTYQVGEFAADQKENGTTLYLKLLKSNSSSPTNGTWDLMMKNIYSLGTNSISSNDFRLNIEYESDSTGTNLIYLPEASLKDKTLLQLVNLDRLDAKQNANPNGFFDYVEGYTVQSSSGRIVFPVVEPFGGWLRKVIGNDAIADKYVFQELYDSTRTAAKQVAEKNKFLLTGEYAGSNGSEISLGAYNIPRGSVTVTAGGVTLTENSDYTVDYTRGVVNIVNQSILDAGTPINVSLESNTAYNMQRKTMMGVNWAYDFSKDFQIGGTMMHLSEKPLTTKVEMGSEPLKNTLWGLNMAWKHESQWLTNMLDYIPGLHVTQPSSINLTADFAQLIAGVSDQVQGSASYIDDFESSESGIRINTPSEWMLASIPSTMPYATLTNDVRTGMNRALFNWFTIDPLFTRRNSSLTPAHLKSDLDQLSNHYVREVYERDLYPNKESTYGESSTLSILNLAYYPDERGPYNLDTDLTAAGKLNRPEERWGGIMRQLSTTDFETSNIEYIEFWMMDPFVYEPDSKGGDFYINIGEVSEDILKDGKKFYENGMYSANNVEGYAETVWGRVPKAVSLVYAFDNNSDSRNKQDVGLNGLSSSEEAAFPTYADYLAAIQPKVEASVYQQFLADPAADNFHHYRGADYDNMELGILDRYKHYNGTEGNSKSTANNDSYDKSAKTTPDVEDINQDYTLDEYEKYFEYHISLRPQDLVVGRNHITDKRLVKSKLRNGTTESVNWYKFRVPINAYESTVGSIRDFSSIRFMRLYMTRFSAPVVVRLASMELIRGTWRTYDQPIYSANNPSPQVSGTMVVGSVNIEENGDRAPVNYVMPPGITRILDPSQPQLRQDNEQALSIQITGLEPGEARAIYKKDNLDLRKYEHIQMFVHAEELIDSDQPLDDDQLSVFVRIGSDYKSNYYEYEIPLEVTPEGYYDGNIESERRLVWPESNMLDIDFATLTEVKKLRNTEANMGGDVSKTTLYSIYDERHPKNRISIIGNPTIGKVKTFMIGVRNNSRATRSAEIWVNEMRLTGLENRGGWATQGALDVKLSDVGTVNMTGHVETAGFGGLEQGVSQRRVDDLYQYSMTTSFDLGRFFPEDLKVSLPLYYSMQRERVSPLYSPFETDLYLDDMMETLTDRQQRDSLSRIANEVVTSKNFSLSNVKVNVSSKKPMPYDPSNFSFGFSHSVKDEGGNTLDYRHNLNWKAQAAYAYAPAMKPIEPFKNLIKSKSKWFDLLRDFGISPLPQSFSFNTDMNRVYFEQQMRDLEGSYGAAGIPVNFSQEFLWNRKMAVRWDLTKNLKMNLSTGTNAEIEEPYAPVNRTLYPDDYAFWKDSVRYSIQQMGRPLTYQQNFTASYQAPINKIPLLDWITADGSFNSSYNWKRGATLANGNSYGGTVGNQRAVTLNGKTNFETLYNKVEFLKETNKKFASSGKSTTTRGKTTAKTAAKKATATTADKKKKPKNFSSEYTLVPDSVYVVQHGQKDKHPDVSFRTKDGHSYKVRYKVVDENTIRFRAPDSTAIKLTVAPGPDPSEQGWYKSLQYASRFLMMVRNASASYKNTYAMTLPGFMPEPGKAFGQSVLGAGAAPGWDFAFGLTGDDYISRAAQNGWLLQNDSVAYASASSAVEELQLKVTLEPARDFKIDVNGSWSRNDSRSIQFMYAGMPETRTGQFNMTTITIGSAFEPRRAADGYRSATFEQFVQSLPTMRSRVEGQYSGARYPMTSSRPGQPFDPSIGGVGLYSPDVMIPAFLAAYSGRDVHSSPLSLFPSMLSLLPNWKVTYGGLGKLPFFRDHFKSVNINHSYKSVYSVGSFSTFATYMSYMGDLGFIEDVTTGNPIPSSMFDISAVSINEQFSPLLGVDVTTPGNLTAKLEYKKTRVLNLSMTAVQLVETGSDDIVVGLGYKITNLKILGAGRTPSTGGRGKVNNDMNLRCDFSFRDQSALCRNIQDFTTQATSGNKAIKLSLSADYAYSKMLTLNAYFDHQTNIPVVSASSYPTSTNDFGVSLKFSLTK